MLVHSKEGRKKIIGDKTQMVEKRVETLIRSKIVKSRTGEILVNAKTNSSIKTTDKTKKADP